MTCLVTKVTRHPWLLRLPSIYCYFGRCHCVWSGVRPMEGHHEGRCGPFTCKLLVCLHCGNTADHPENTFPMVKHGSASNGFAFCQQSN
ncbi:hypothetical protein XELAEV_18015220mg [Xenopus laevis]|uniref:Uncharacterized protein n=1 Tax=Xenopus laevis TaxID=8355 RepID=A0A974DJZ6_XENLA|nr:hypothetical protein XELAEV_18015220mg [Xenopus laevis]